MTLKPKQSKVDPKAILSKSYLERIEGELENQGVVFFDETRLDIDSDFLTLPREITEVSSKDLGEYLNAFTQQKIYYRTLLGRISLQVEEAKRAYLDVSDPYYRKVSRDKISETSKDRLINAEEAVKPFFHDLTDLRKSQELIEIAILNIEDAVFMLSREVTRRTGDFNEESRAYNVTRK